MRLRQCRVHTTPSCRPERHEAAALELPKDGSQGTLPLVPGGSQGERLGERRGSTCGSSNGGDHSSLVVLQGQSVHPCGDGHILDGQAQGFEQSDFVGLVFWEAAAGSPLPPTRQPVPSAGILFRWAAQIHRIPAWPDPWNRPRWYGNASDRPRPAPAGPGNCPRPH